MEIKEQKEKIKEYTLVFTGGHHTPALAVISALEKLCPKEIKLKFVWFGHRYSMWGDKNDSAEFLEVTARKIRFFDLRAGKSYRTLNPAKLWRHPLGFWQAWQYLRQVKPNLIVSFGGYLAVPTVIVGRVSGIPAVTHEQTTAPGLANRLLGRLATKVYVSWPGTESYFPPRKVIFTGLPLRPEIKEVRDKEPERLRSKVSPKLWQFVKNAGEFNLPLIYVTGGKQGAHAINLLLRESLDRLTKVAAVVHQCGSTSVTNDLVELSKITNTRYLLSDYFSAYDNFYLLRESALVVARSGANTVAELATLGTPAMLIPLPSSSNNEQLKNADLLAQLGLVEVVAEKDLNSQLFVNQTVQMLGRVDEYKEKYQAQVPLWLKDDAAETVAREILAALALVAEF
ncbi:MAG: glycosyltransferase [bacterium]|nr:glycosyltransferase [bacterium]